MRLGVDGHQFSTGIQRDAALGRVDQECLAAAGVREVVDQRVSIDPRQLHTADRLRVAPQRRQGIGQVRQLQPVSAQRALAGAEQGDRRGLAAGVIVGVDPDRVDEVAAADHAGGAQPRSIEDDQSRGQGGQPLLEPDQGRRSLLPERLAGGQQRKVGDPEPQRRRVVLGGPPFRDGIVAGLVVDGDSAGLLYEGLGQLLHAEVQRLLRRHGAAPGADCKRMRQLRLHCRHRLITFELPPCRFELCVTGLTEHQEKRGAAFLPGDVKGATQIVISCVRELSQEFDMRRRGGHVRIF